MEEDIRQKISELFKTSQATAAVHQKNAVLLKRLYENSDKNIFLSQLKRVINIILSIERGNKFIDKIINFFGQFCSILNHKQVETERTLECIEHPLLSEIFVHLLKCSLLEKDIVRFRSCQMINKILDSLVGSDVSSDLCDKLEETLLIRLQDPKVVIRQQAVIALHRLQDPTNSQDAIIPQFIHLMKSDSFAKVRLSCIENIAARKDVINHIVLRTRDVDAHVRLAAYKRLSNFAEFLKISQKRHVLFAGFLDSSEKIKNFISTSLIQTWLEYYDNNILELLKSVRLDATEKDIEETQKLYEYVLTAYFKDKPLKELSYVLPINDNRLISKENLNWESSSYWRIYVQYLSNNEFEDEMEVVLPEFVYFAKYVEEYYTHTRKEVTTIEFLEQQFILKQMFLIIKTFDFSDVTSRQHLNLLVRNIIENAVLMSDVIQIIISTLENSITNIDSRSLFVSEIISDIMYPIDSEEWQKMEQEREFQLAKNRVKLNCLLDRQNEAVQQENYIEAESLKQQISETSAYISKLKNPQITPQQQVEKKTDIPTIIKYLDVAVGLLLSSQVTKLLPSLNALKDNVIQELLIHENDNVRAKALQCYALCCIVDKGCASIGIHIFSTPIFAYQNGEECDTQTLIICIKAAVDLLRIYGSQLMAAPGNEVLSESMQEEHERVFAGGTSLTDLIQGLVDLMDDELYEVQEIAARGLCQLILSDRIHSPSLISRLVLKWCNPITEEDEYQRITQIIGFTLQKVPSVTDSSVQLEEAVLMTIRALFYAPKASPLADVNIDNIAKFMIELCNVSPDGPQINSNLVTAISYEIKRSPRNKINTVLAKMLLMLEIPNDKVLVRELLKICDGIRDDANDQAVLNNIVKFVTLLNGKNVFVIEEQEELEQECCGISGNKSPVLNNKVTKKSIEQVEENSHVT